MDMEMAAGFVVMLFPATVGVTFGGVIVSLLSFAGLLAGANLIAAAVVLVAYDPGARVGVAAFLRRHLTVLGLSMASCAITEIDGEAGPVLCFGMFALLLLALALINIGVLGK